MNQIQANKDLARRFLEELVNEAAVEKLAEFLAPDYVAHDACVTGLDAARQHLLTMHHFYPDLRVQVEGQVAEGDMVVTWWLLRGTHLGQFCEVPATGKPITLRGVNIQRIRNDRIVDQWGGSTSLEALLEIGVVRWNTLEPQNSQPK
jgi:steroid delta-isomerase-like uncharacterized protein